MSPSQKVPQISVDILKIVLRKCWHRNIFVRDGILSAHKGHILTWQRFDLVGMMAGGKPFISPVHGNGNAVLKTEPAHNGLEGRTQKNSCMLVQGEVV